MTRILVVDDVPAMAEQYAYDLRRLGGWKTRVATGGREALDVLSEETVEAVLLDLEMPGVDGFEVLETMIRRGDETPAPSRILVASMIARRNGCRFTETSSSRSQA